MLVTGTALAIWLEPVRTTFNYGQINLFLALLLLAGAAISAPTTKSWQQVPAQREQTATIRGRVTNAGTSGHAGGRAAVAGLTVGVTAGIKVVPAIEGL